mmetsp:Transcript_11198/g.29177  ORF Transcript_11198/g.29177 Transcript_11198/m.29177 type:complete len:282 (+) Transcript_11198:584-1429(+)
MYASSSVGCARASFSSVTDSICSDSYDGGGSSGATTDETGGCTGTGTGTGVAGTVCGAAEGVAGTASSSRLAANEAGRAELCASLSSSNEAFLLGLAGAACECVCVYRTTSVERSRHSLLEQYPRPYPRLVAPQRWHRSRGAAAAEEPAAPELPAPPPELPARELSAPEVPAAPLLLPPSCEVLSDVAASFGRFSGTWSVVMYRSTSRRLPPRVGATTTTDPALDLRCDAVATTIATGAELHATACAMGRAIGTIPAVVVECAAECDAELGDPAPSIGLVV